MHRGGKVAVEHDPVVLSVGHKLHILGRKLAERRREAALDILIGLAHGVDRKRYRVVFRAYFRILGLHAAYFRAEHQRIAHCGKSSAVLCHLRGNAAAFCASLGQPAAELGGLIIAAGEVELSERFAFGLLLTAAHHRKSLRALLLGALRLGIVFVKLKIFVDACGNIGLGFGLILGKDLAPLLCGLVVLRFAAGCADKQRNACRQSDCCRDKRVDHQIRQQEACRDERAAQDHEYYREHRRAFALGPLF